MLHITLLLTTDKRHGYTFLRKVAYKVAMLHHLSMNLVYDCHTLGIGHGKPVGSRNDIFYIRQ